MSRAITPETARAYMARDWRGLRDSKRRYWRDRLDREGLAAALDISESLRLEASLNNPNWPTEQQREEDLQTHTRVARALQATAPERRSRATRRTRRVR